MDRVVGPIKDAVDEVKTFVETLDDFVGDLSFGRRLEELTPAEMVHARGLKEQAHRQLEQVRGRLLHADNDDAHDSTKERLLSDVHRRLEVHLAERKLAARQLGSELVSISSLKASIQLGLDSRLLIEGSVGGSGGVGGGVDGVGGGGGDDGGKGGVGGSGGEGQIEKKKKKKKGMPGLKDYLLPLATEDESFEKIIPLPYTPFYVKLAASFSVDASLEVQLEANLKALVHLVVDSMGVDFDLATGAQNPIVFSEGNWT